MSINNKRSYTEYTVTQPTTDFAIGFDDFDEGSKDNILVTLNGVLVESLGYAAIRKNESTVTITPAITEGIVRLTRETDIDEPFHKFTAGALFSAKSMDENFQQVRHSQQEVRDGFEYLEFNTSGIISAAKIATNRANAAADEIIVLTDAVNSRVDTIADSQEATIQRVDNFIATDVTPIVNDAISKMGFVTIDSFELGATITQRNQALRHTADGKLYRWAGNLPKVVPASSTPANSGGIGTDAWLEVSDTTLRQNLISSEGTTLISDGTQSQKQINLFGGKKYDMPLNGYPIGAVVILENGDLVRSSVENNITNPNQSLIGWVNITALVKRSIDLVVLVDDFFTIGDVDDTASIQRAMDAIGSSGGGTLSFKSGKVYNIGRGSEAGDYNYSLLIKHSNLIFEGNGATIRLRDTQDCTMIRTAFGRDGQATMLTNIKFNDLYIDGNWDGQTWAGPVGKEGLGIYDQNGLSLYAVSNVELNNVHTINIAQDGFACASCDTIRYNNCSSVRTGKNNFQCFLSHDVVYTNCVGEYSNASPNPTTKPIYTTSTDRYSAFGGSGASTLLDKPVYSGVLKLNYNHNKVVYNNCKAVTHEGRGFSLLYNMNDVTYNNCDVYSIGVKHGFSFSFSSNSVPSRVVLRNCKYITRDIVTNNIRAMSCTNTNRVLVDGFDIETTSSASLYASLTFIGCGSVAIKGFYSTQDAVSTVAVDARGCNSVVVSGAEGVGSISFNTTQTDYAEIRLNKLSVVGKSLVGKYISDVTLLRTSAVLVSETVASNSSVTTVVDMVGVDFGDNISYSLSNVPSNLESFIITAYVSAKDKVTVRRFNNTAEPLAIGSTTIYLTASKS